MQGKEPSHLIDEISPSSSAKKPKISSTILDVTCKEQLEGAQEALIKCYEEDLQEELLTCKMTTLVVGNASSLLINSVVQGIAGAAKNKQEYTILVLPQEVLLTDDTMDVISNAQLILQYGCDDEKTPSNFDDELEIDLDDYELPPAQEILNNCYQNYFQQKLDFLVDTVFLTPCEGNEDELSAVAWGLLEALRGRDTPVKIIVNSSLPAKVQGQLMYHLNEALNTNPNPNCHITIGYRSIPTLKDICLSYLATNNHLIPSDLEAFPAEIQHSFSKIVCSEIS